MTTLNDRIKDFFTEMATDAVEERVIEYVVREVHGGRRLMEVIDDPYVRNRLNEDKRVAVLENSDVVEALEQEIRVTMSKPELGFGS